MNGKAMTRGEPWKQILSFSFPILAGALLQQLYNTADTVIVGNFSGENALAALSMRVVVTSLLKDSPFPGYRII